MKSGFQWFVAWRYLMARPRKVSGAILGVAVFALVLAACGHYAIALTVLGLRSDLPPLGGTGMFGIARQAHLPMQAVAIAGVCVAALGGGAILLAARAARSGRMSRAVAVACVSPVVILALGAPMVALGLGGDWLMLRQFAPWLVVAVLAVVLASDERYATALAVATGIGLFAAGALAAIYTLAAGPNAGGFAELWMWVGGGASGVLELVVLLGVLRYFFTFFTTVSMGGVAIGTMALVIVLSVMNGFESDLREKILGSNAHVLVTKLEGEPFTEYRRVAREVDEVPGVIASTPYLTSEVVIGAASNYSNVVIKGVDPLTVALVTDLEENLQEEGSLERLWPLHEDGGIRRAADAGVAFPGPEPIAADAGAAASGDDGLPDDFAVPDDEPVDFSGGIAELPEPVAERAPELPEGDPIDLSGAGDDEPGIAGAPGEDLPAAIEPDVLVLGDDPFDELTRREGRGYAGARRNVSSSPRVNQLDGVLVGRELVKNLHLYTGQEVSLVSPLGQMTPAGPAPRTKPYRVAGTFYTGMYEYDTKFIYVELGSLQRFLSLGDEVNGIEIRVEDPERTERIKNDIERRLGPGYDVKDWKEINRNLFSALKLEKIAMFLVLAIIILVASFSIIGNLIMVVVEKAREIALLKTLGASNQGIMKIFIVQGFFIGLVGTVVGVANGLLVCWLGKRYGLPLDPDVYYIDRLPIDIEGMAVVAVAVAGVLISVVATLYPAWLGARVEPVEGLRYE